MKSRTLGPTGYTVSEIGFGGWGLGADMWRGVDDAMAREALRAAQDQGITFFDTALAYGNGHSERLIGEVLRVHVRAGHVRVATKVPPLNNEWPGRADRPLAAVFPARHIAASTETSLQHLGVEALALQQLHVWHDAWLDDPEWEACYNRMVGLKREGKVLHWGISINDHAPETALRVLQNPLFETAQVIYNIYDRSPETALFALARTKPLGIIVRVPFDEGALTGQIRSTTVFPPGDWRDAVSAAALQTRGACLEQELVPSLDPLAVRHPAPSGRQRPTARLTLWAGGLGDPPGRPTRPSARTSCPYRSAARGAAGPDP